MPDASPPPRSEERQAKRIRLDLGEYEGEPVYVDATVPADYEPTDEDREAWRRIIVAAFEKADADA